MDTMAKSVLFLAIGTVGVFIGLLVTINRLLNQVESRKGGRGGRKEKISTTGPIIFVSVMTVLMTIGYLFGGLIEPGSPREQVHNLVTLLSLNSVFIGIFIIIVKLIEKKPVTKTIKFTFICIGVVIISGYI